MKKITRRSFITVCGAAAAAMALTACGGSASSTVASSAAESTASSAAESVAAGTLSGNVATGGSTSMKNVIAALTEGFAARTVQNTAELSLLRARCAQFFCRFRVDSPGKSGTLKAQNTARGGFSYG